MTDVDTINTATKRVKRTRALIQSAADAHARALRDTETTQRIIDRLRRDNLAAASLAQAIDSLEWDERRA